MQKLKYDLRGTASDECTVFLHGFLGSSKDWSSFRENLLDKYTLSIDLPGHGESVGVEAIGIPETAKQIKEIIDDLGIKKIRLVAYSLGGRIAFSIFDQFPEIITSALIISASPGLEQEKDRTMRLHIDQQLAQKLENQDFATFLTDWYELAIFNKLRESRNFVDLIRTRMDNDKLALSKTMVAYSPGTMPQYWDMLKENKVPLVYLAGKEDMKYSSTALKMSATSSNVKVNVIPGCGHAIMVEKPDFFGKVLNEFLNKDYSNIEN